MTKRTRLYAGLFVFLSIGCVLYGTTFGQPDGTRHPFVGTIIFQSAGGYFACSATLMNPTVLLTAGHCTEEEGVPNLKTWANFSESISFPGRSNYSSLGDYLDDPANGWIPGQAIPHPQYDDYAEFPAIYDVGVVILSTPVNMGTYGALPPLNFLSTIRGRATDTFTIVGYGMQGLIKPFFEDIYARYFGSVRLVELKSTFDAGMTAKYTNNPGIGGGSCFGDSGGPIFYSNTNMVVSLVSYGFTPCIGVDYNFRVDTPIAQDFLTGYIH
jgi:hypothetical protein